MSQIDSEERSKILRVLRKHAPYSIIDSGIELAESGAVVESNKQGSRIHGIVKESEESQHSVSLEVLASQEIVAECSCCSREEMDEQWCSHAIAVFARACELQFFDAHHGFPATESTIRLNTSSPEEIALVITEISRVEYRPKAPVVLDPTVEIVLDLKSDRLGVQILFDGEPQGPQLFEGYKPPLKRALNEIIVRLLDDEGSFDEAHHFWYVNASGSIETILGIIREYPRVISAQDLKPINFSDDLLEAQLHLTWQEASLELSMFWKLANGDTIPKQSELLGTGPFWTSVDHTIYRISPTAAKIASIFPYGSNLVLMRSAVGPILSAIRDDLPNPALVEIHNPDLQPEAEVKQPVPVLELERRETQLEHFASQQHIEVQATLRFDYPVPEANRNVVYLPDREAERECSELLSSMGFVPMTEKSRYSISGDDALDLIDNGKKVFPPSWEVSGFEVARKGLRFSKLELNVSLNAEQDAAKKKSAKPQWFDCHVSLTQNKANVPLSILFKRARSESDRWIHLDGGAYAKVPGGTLAQLKMTLGMLDPNFKLSNTIRAKLSTVQAFGLSRMEDGGISISLDRQLSDLAKKLKDFVAISPIKPTKQFKGKLRSYQQEGLSWLNFLHDFELGGILADEMGLGKTVQALSFLQTLRAGHTSTKKSAAPLPALIVAPTSVLMNWAYEAKRFTPNLSVLLLHGPGRKQYFQDIPKYDIVLTSYALLRLDRQELEKHEFSYSILDEAQNIKNPFAATTRAAKAIRARRRLALTGTPTENRPLELWSIMDFLLPGYLGSADFFKSYIEKPILDGGVNQQATRLLNAKTKPFILRRTKAEVEKDLPPKIEAVQHVEMTQSQALLYSQILEEVRPRVFEAVEKKGVKGASVSILAALLRLRQVCNHPNSIESLKDLSGYDSGKFNLLKDLLDEALEAKRKILVFSQFRGMLDIIREWLNSKEYRYLYLDGATTNRQSLIDQFNNDESVRLFLISLKAGGTGLNLTAADTVVIYDPWWNPAVESQAVDRAHRIGQTKAVSVYRLVTENSVEQKIMDLKEKKSQIVDALVNENGLSTLQLSKADLMNLFSPLPATEVAAEEEA